MKRKITLLLAVILLLCLCFALGSCGNDNPPAPDEHTTHEWDEGRIATEPTCEGTGTKIFTCKVCAETKEEEVPALGHDFSDEWQNNSQNHWHSCKREGCTKKGDIGTHAYVESAELSTPATCGTAGEIVRVCVCGLDERETVPATGVHTPSETLSGDDEEHYHECTVCHTKLDGEKHTFDDGVEEGISHTSCKDGKKVYTCSECGYKKQTVLASGVAHTPKYVLNIKERTMVQHCTVCDSDIFILTNQFVMDFEDKEAGKPFSNNPNTVKSRVKDLNGNLCGFLFDDVDDKNGSNVSTPSLTPVDLTIRDVNILTLRWMPVWTDEDNAVQKNTNLTVNGKYKKGTDKWGSFGATGLNSDDTLKVGGWNSPVKAVADKWYTLIYVYTKADNTLTCYVIDEAGNVESGKGTCGDAFTTADSWAYFTVAVAIDGQGTYIDDIAIFTADLPKTETHEHKWNDGEVTTAATCKEGVKTYTCTVCGETRTEAIPATGSHNPTGDLLHNESGHWHICSECGEKADYEEHKWGDADIIKAPNCTETGEAKYTCSVCNVTKTEVLPVKHVPAETLSHDDEGHWYECTLCHEKVDYTAHDLEEISGEYVAPKCNAEGKKVYKCSVCEAEITEILKRTEHDFTEVVTTPATCLVEGKKTLTCADCGKILSDVTIPKTQHKLTFTVDGTDVNVTCATEGCALHTAYKVGRAISDDAQLGLSGNQRTEYNNGTEITELLGEDGNKYHSIVRTAESNPAQKSAQIQFWMYNSAKGTSTRPAFTLKVSHPEAGPLNIGGEFMLLNYSGQWGSNFEGKGLVALDLKGGNITAADGKVLGTYTSGAWTEITVVADMGVASGADGVRENDTCTLLYYIDGEYAGMAVVPGTLKNDTYQDLYINLHTNEKGTGLYFKDFKLFEDTGDNELFAPVHEHTFVDEDTLAEGDCQKGGLVRQICSVCGAQNLKKVGGSHTWEVVEVTNPATCTEEGEQSMKCKYCDATTTETIPAKGHHYTVNEEESTAPGCITAGKKVSYCDDCHDRKEETVPATGHTLTYTKNADKLDVACSVCNKTYASLSTKLSQDFNKYEVGNAGATCSDGAKLVSRSGDASKILERAEGDKFLHICDDCSDNNVAYDFFNLNMGAMDFIVVELDFMLRWTDGETVVDGVINFNLHSGTYWNNPGLLTDVKTQGDKVSLFGKTTDIDVVTDKWYTARTVVDFVDGIMYVFIDDTLVHTASTKGMSISESVSRGNSTVLNDGQCARIDNLRIYAGNLDKVEIPEKAVAPTCDKTGSKTYLNPYTGEEQTVTVPPLGHTFAFVKDGEELSAVCSVCTHEVNLTLNSKDSDNFKGGAAIVGTESDGNKYANLHDTKNTADASLPAFPKDVNGQEGFLVFAMRYQLKNVTVTKSDGTTVETVTCFRAPIKFDVGNSKNQWITPFTFAITDGYMVVNGNKTEVEAKVDVWTDFMIAYEKATGKFSCYIAGTFVAKADANANFKAMTNLQYVSIQIGNSPDVGDQVWIDDLSFYTDATA